MGGTDKADGSTEAASEEVVTEDQLNHLWNERHDVHQRVVLSARYHRRRERFFDSMERATQAAALIGGTSAFAAMTSPGVVMLASGVVAVTGAIALVFGFGEKARRHASLADAFKRVESEIMASSDYDLKEVEIMGWRGKLAEIESGEPPALRPLVLMCQNDMDVARGEPEKVTYLPPSVRFFGNFIDLDVSRWVRLDNESQHDKTKSPA